LEAREAFEAKIRANGEFEMRLAETRALVDSRIAGFSPASIVDECPLRDLPRDTRTLIKSAVHAAYLEVTGITSMIEQVRIILAQVEDDLFEFRSVWFAHPPSAKNRIEEAFSRFRERALKLHRALDEFPDGVVVP